MRYVIDIHASPPCVVLVSDDAQKTLEVGQRYADQVGRDLVVAIGPPAVEPTIRPTIAQAPPAELEGDDELARLRARVKELERR